MGTPTPVRNRYLKQSKIMQSIKILIAVLALAGAVYSQEDTVVPEVSSVEETATPVLTSHAKSPSSKRAPPPSPKHTPTSTTTSPTSSKSTTKPRSCRPSSSRPSPRTVRTSTTTWSSGASSRRQLPPSPTASPVSVAASPTLLVRHGAPSREALAPSGQPPRRPDRGRAIHELFKKAIQVCAQLCVRVASYIAVSG